MFQILQDPLLQYGLLPTNESSTTTSKKQLLRTNTEMKWTDPNQAFLMNVLDGEEGKCVKRVGLYNTTTVSKCQIQMNYKEKQE